MVWDLRRALLAKEEFESARLTDFEFRETVRAIRLLAARSKAEAQPLLHLLADEGVEAVLAALAQVAGSDPAEMEARYLEARAEARRQLIAERGDPSPHRLG